MEGVFGFDATGGAGDYDAEGSGHAKTRDANGAGNRVPGVDPGVWSLEVQDGRLRRTLVGRGSKRFFETN